MKLIIVERSKPETYERLRKQFEDDLNVAVLRERRTKPRRNMAANRGPERRSRERRKFTKPFNGRDYLVIHIASSPRAR